MLVRTGKPVTYQSGPVRLPRRTPKPGAPLCATTTTTAATTTTTTAATTTTNDHNSHTTTTTTNNNNINNNDDKYPRSAAPRWRSPPGRAGAAPPAPCARGGYNMV